MAALPKRKHSTQRKGKRLNARKVILANLIKCKKCEKMKLPHKVCGYCGSK